MTASFMDFKSALLCYCKHQTHPSWIKQKIYLKDIRQLTISMRASLEATQPGTEDVMNQHLPLRLQTTRSPSPRACTISTTKRMWYGDRGSLIQSKTSNTLLPIPSIAGKKELVKILWRLMHICFRKRWVRRCSIRVGAPPMLWHHRFILDDSAGRDHPARKIGK